VEPISVQEAARRYGVSEATIRRLIRSGELIRYSRRGDRRAFVDREVADRVFEFRPRQ